MLRPDIIIHERKTKNNFTMIEIIKDFNQAPPEIRKKHGISCAKFKAVLGDLWKLYYCMKDKKYGYQYSASILTLWDEVRFAVFKKKSIE